MITLSLKRANRISFYLLVQFKLQFLVELEVAECVGRNVIDLVESVGDKLFSELISTLERVWIGSATSIEETSSEDT